jgi:hypothetical protein
MGAVTVDPVSGRLVADSATIARLKALVAEGAEELESEVRPPRPQPRRIVNPQTNRTASGQVVGDDAEIEHTLIGLIGQTSEAARKAFALARQEGHAGGSVEVYGVCLSQGSRAASACAALVEALTRHRVKGVAVQRIVVQHLHPGSQAVGMVG